MEDLVESNPNFALRSALLYALNYLIDKSSQFNFHGLYPSLVRQCINEIFTDRVVSKAVDVPRMSVLQVDSVVDDLLVAVQYMAEVSYSGVDYKKTNKQLVDCLFNAHNTTVVDGLFRVATQLRGKQAGDSACYDRAVRVLFDSKHV